jgi:hypothetical protein
MELSFYMSVFTILIIGYENINKIGDRKIKKWIEVIIRNSATKYTKLESCGCKNKREDR